MKKPNLIFMDKTQIYFQISEIVVVAILKNLVLVSFMLYQLQIVQTIFRIRSGGIEREQ